MQIKTAELAKILNVTSKTVAAWVRAGMPKNGHGSYDLADALTWWQIHIVNSGHPDLTESKKQYWAARARREVLQADFEADLYILAADIEKEEFETGRMIRESLEAIPGRLAPILAAEMDSFQCEKMLGDEIHHVLVSLADRVYQRGMDLKKAKEKENAEKKRK